MKTVKKLLAVLLAAIMLLALGVTAGAAKNSDDGSITINNAVDGQTYKIYQLLKLEAYDTAKDAYLYTIEKTSAWYDFFDTGKGSEYVKLTEYDTETYYVTWKVNEDAAAAFAQAALDYADEEGIDATQEATASGDTVIFTNLNLGYYLVDSSLGSLCFLNTTATDAEINEKNSVPTIKKEVQEDITGLWGTENSAQIGDTVNFRTTVTAGKGESQLILHDKMDAGLTLDSDSIRVSVDGGDELKENQDYTVALGTDSTVTDGCTFEITFKTAYLDSLTGETELVVTYSALLNENAVIYDKSNNNTTWLTYGEGTDTQEQTTNTYTYEFTLLKYDAEDEDKTTKTPLAGAEFQLMDGDKNVISLVKIDGTTYRVATDDDTDRVTTFTTVDTGKITIRGLDLDTYYLEETKAPDGYHKLDEAVEFTVNAEKDGTVITFTEVGVANEAGAKLPSTGGIGTTIFYVLGTILVVGAAILLIVRRRAGSEK